MIKNLPLVQETQVQSLGWEDPLEKGKATHSSILAWLHRLYSSSGCKELDTTEQLSLSPFDYGKIMTATANLIHIWNYEHFQFMKY